MNLHLRMKFLVYTLPSPRVRYTFKQLLERIIGLEVVFTNEIEQFVAHSGPKCSYGEEALGQELFFKTSGLLFDHGIDETLKPEVTYFEKIPEFFSVKHPKAAINFDVFSASFYLLSRYEEYVPHSKDAYGFPATESLAFKEGFLQLPIVDIWATQLKGILKKRFPEIKFQEKKAEVELICEVKEAYAFRKKGWFRNFEGYISDLGSLQIKRIIQRSKVLFKLEKDPFQVYNYMINTARKNQATLRFFFGLGNYSYHEKSVNYQSQTYQRLIKSIADYCGIGIRFSLDGLEEERTLKTEQKRFEKITHREAKTSFCQYAKLNLPTTYRNLIEQEVTTDYSMGYLNHAGFRAGTCSPFFFYDLEYEIQTPLKIIPFCMSENAFLGFKSAFKAEEAASKIVTDVLNVNGKMVIHFYNHLLDKTSKRYEFWQSMYQYFVKLHH